MIDNISKIEVNITTKMNKNKALGPNGILCIT